jgi:hypothetical protein
MAGHPNSSSTATTRSPKTFLQELEPLLAESRNKIRKVYNDIVIASNYNFKVVYLELPMIHLRLEDGKLKTSTESKRRLIDWRNPDRYIKECPSEIKGDSTLKEMEKVVYKSKKAAKASSSKKTSVKAAAVPKSKK